MKTTTQQRKAAQRRRDKDAGYVRIDVKVKSEHKQAVIEFVAWLNSHA